jgi:hypothetical protein
LLYKYKQRRFCIFFGMDQFNGFREPSPSYQPVIIAQEGVPRVQAVSPSGSKSPESVDPPGVLVEGWASTYSHLETAGREEPDISDDEAYFVACINVIYGDFAHTGILHT